MPTIPLPDSGPLACFEACTYTIITDGQTRRVTGWRLPWCDRWACRAVVRPAPYRETLLLCIDWLPFDTEVVALRWTRSDWRTLADIVHVLADAAALHPDAEVAVSKSLAEAAKTWTGARANNSQRRAVTVAHWIAEQRGVSLLPSAMATGQRWAPPEIPPDLAAYRPPSTWPAAAALPTPRPAPKNVPTLPLSTLLPSRCADSARTSQIWIMHLPWPNGIFGYPIRGSVACTTDGHRLGLVPLPGLSVDGEYVLPKAWAAEGSVEDPAVDLTVLHRLASRMLTSEMLRTESTEAPNAWLPNVRAAIDYEWKNAGLIWKVPDPEAAAALLRRGAAVQRWFGRATPILVLHPDPRKTGMLAAPPPDGYPTPPTLPLDLRCISWAGKCEPVYVNAHYLVDALVALDRSADLGCEVFMVQPAGLLNPIFGLAVHPDGWLHQVQVVMPRRP